MVSIAFMANAQWNYLEQINKGVSSTARIDAGKNDLLVVSDNEIYTAGSYQQIEVQKYNGTTWEIIPSPNTGGTVGNIYLRKAKNSNDLYIAYAYNGPYYKIQVKKYDGSAWTTVGAELSLPIGGTGSFAFELDNNDVPVVFGEGAFGNRKINRFVNGAWSAIEIPNSSAATFYYHNTYVDNQNNIFFIYNYSGFANGAIFNHLIIGKLNGSTLETIGQINDVANTTNFLVGKDSEVSVISTTAPAAATTSITLYEYNNSTWSASSSQTTDANNIRSVGKSPDGENLVVKTHSGTGENHVFSDLFLLNNLSNPIYTPNVSFTDVCKVNFSSNYIYVLETNGVLKHSLPLSQITAIPEDVISNQELAVFPNPFYSDINFTGLVNNEVLLVFDTQNKLIMETKVNAGNVNLEHLKSGIYYLRIGGRTAKVIKQ